MLKMFYYEATTINDAWFALVYNIFDPNYSRRYTINRGSYEGDERIEYFWAIVRIKQPGVRPLAVQMPEGSNLDVPTDENTIEQYFVNYLMDDELEKNELYRYSTSIIPQLPEVIKMLKDTPNTNQACITIGRPESIYLDDPECAKVIDCRVIDSVLHFYIYFRSNDLFNAWPTNIGGLQLLKEYICEATGLEDGEILYSSKGLHLYEFSKELAEMRTGLKFGGDE